MKDVADLSVTHYYVFGPSRVPLTHLATRTALEQLQAAFAFREGAALPGMELAFEAGIAAHPELGNVTVRRLHIGERRIVLDIAGESTTAHDVFELMRKEIVRHDPSDRFATAKPVTVRRETTCTAILDVAWERLFNPALVRFLEGTFAPAASDDDAAVELSTLKLRFSYAYQVKNPTVAQHGIALAPKNLIVEPLIDTPLSERRYFTSSPTDSKTHLRLLTELEKVLA